MKKRLNSIQALRALACLVVFLYHSGITCAVSAAVCVFFVLSGFTMSYSYHDRDDVSGLSLRGCIVFAVKRIKKLYPLYIICMLPVMALDLWELSRAFSPEAALFFLKKLAASLLLVQSWFPNTDIALAFNGVAWFLSSTMFLYFCFPFILRLLKKLRSRGSLIVLMAALALVQLLLGFAAAPLESLLLKHGLIPNDGKFAYWFSYIFPLFRLFDFSIGCIAGLLFVRRSDVESKKTAYCFELLTLALLVVSLLVYYRSDSFITGEAFSYTQLFVPFSAAAVYCFALGLGPLTKLLTNRFTLFLGNISSDFFLLHQDVIRLSIMFLSALAIPFSAIKIIIPPLCFALTIAACLIWSRLKKLFRRRKTA